MPDDFLYGNALCEDADGGFWFLYTTMNNSLAIARYGTDFAVQETFLTSCENEDQLYFQLLKTDGEFYLLSRGAARSLGRKRRADGAGCR